VDVRIKPSSRSDKEMAENENEKEEVS